jgi:hypothetical protein
MRYQGDALQNERILSTVCHITVNFRCLHNIETEK